MDNIIEEYQMSITPTIAGFHSNTPIGRNRTSYTSPLEKLIGWQTVYPITQEDVGTNSNKFLAKLTTDVNLYKSVLDQQDPYQDVIKMMEAELDQVFTRILSLLGNEFSKSPFGALYREYTPYKEISTEKVHLDIGSKL